MKVTKEERPEREVELTIELEPQDLEPYLEKSYRRLVQRTSIPGFRPGKAPRTVVERFLGKDRLLDESLDFLLPEATRKAMEELQLEQGGAPSVEVVKRDPITLKATVPLTPLVELNDYQAIRAQQEPSNVTDEEFQQALERLRQDQAPWEPVSRPLALGDGVTMDVRGWAGAEQVTNQKGVVYEALPESANPVPGFAEGLVGMAPGESREFTVSLPQDYRDRRLAGRGVRFQVTVHELKEKRVPELNDEFAKGVGEGYDTLEALKAKVRQDLSNQKEQEAKRRLEDQLVDELVGQARVELPPLLVEREIHHVLHDEQEALQRQQLSMEHYLQQVGKSPQEHREELRPLALRRLTRNHVLHQFAQAEGLTVLPEEVQAKLESLLESDRSGAALLRRSLDTPEGRESLATSILTRKVLDRLMAIAQGTAASAAPEGAAEPPEQQHVGGTQHAGTTG
ncbi:MAG: trigger factor [Chloroflexi bacterium]|nr:trigger factor [Chloroflexota bacterium]